MNVLDMNAIDVNAMETKEMLLLRACQVGILAGGLLLIAMGCGFHAGWARALALILTIGSAAGLLYEHHTSQRGEGPIALALPLAGVLSGLFALLAPA